MPFTYIVSVDACSTVSEVRQSKPRRVKGHIQDRVADVAEGGLNHDPSIPPYVYCTTIAFSQIIQIIKMEIQPIILMLAITQIPVNDSFFFFSII